MAHPPEVVGEFGWRTHPDAQVVDNPHRGVPVQVDVRVQKAAARHRSNDRQSPTLLLPSLDHATKTRHVTTLRPRQPTTAKRHGYLVVNHPTGDDKSRRSHSSGAHDHMRRRAAPEPKDSAQPTERDQQNCPAAGMKRCGRLPSAFATSLHHSTVNSPAFPLGIITRGSTAATPPGRPSHPTRLSPPVLELRMV